QEYRLERVRHLAQLYVRIGSDGAAGRDAVQAHRTTSVARSAPTARSASNTAAISEPRAPAACRPAATSCTEASAFMCTSPSLEPEPAPVPVPPICSVTPAWLTTAAATRRSPPATTVPSRE